MGGHESKSCEMPGTPPSVGLKFTQKPHHRATAKARLLFLILELPSSVSTHEVLALVLIAIIQSCQDSSHLPQAPRD